jgi:hypothetical protein
MILHTILSLEEIFYDVNSIPPSRYVRCSDGLIETREGNTVCRVISTDPSVYLRTEFMPGMPLPKRKS